MPSTGYSPTVRLLKHVKRALPDHGDFLMRYRHVAPWVVLSLSLLLALVFGSVLLGYADRQEHQQVQMQTVELASGIEQRMNGSEVLLRAAATAFAFVPNINSDFFSSYFKGLHLDTRHNGIRGVGWVVPVGRSELTRLEDRMRAEGQRDYFVWPASDEKQIYPILYLEPSSTRTHRVLGFDVFSDPVRRAAMIRAFDTGTPQASASAPEGRPMRNSNGDRIVIYAPVHDADIGHNRREAPDKSSFKGFLFAAFSVEDLVREVMPEAQASNLDIELYDITDGPVRLLYDSRPEIWTAAHDRGKVITTLKVAGRTWRVVVAPIHAWESGNLPQRLLIYFLIGTAVVISILLSGMIWLALRAAAATRVALDRQTEQVEMRTILLRELNHRVKNTLATVNSLAALAREGASDVPSYYAALNGRLRALSATHDLLTSSDWGDTELRDIADAELAPFRGLKGQVLIEGPPIRFDPARALSLGLSIHELATNASKYGALSTPEGHVSLTWEIREDGRLHVCWTETGGPTVPEDRKPGFGSTLVEKLMARQLKADVRLGFPPEGAVCELVIPLEK